MAIQKKVKRIEPRHGRAIEEFKNARDEPAAKLPFGQQ